MIAAYLVFIIGEINTNYYVDIPSLTWSLVQGIGHAQAKHIFDSETCSVLAAIKPQSSDISMGVDHALEYKLGDGVAFAQIGTGD